MPRQTAAEKARAAEEAALEELAALEPEERQALEELAGSGIDLSALAAPADPPADEPPAETPKTPEPGETGPPLEPEPEVPADLRTYKARTAVTIGNRVVAAGELFVARPDHPRVLAGQAVELREAVAPSVAAALAEAAGEAPTG